MLRQRSLRQELMDGNGFDPILAKQSFGFIGRVNRWFGGTGMVWEFIRAEAAALSQDRPLRVLDIGSGSCDIPAAVCGLAAKENIRVEFTCVEKNLQAVACARRTLAGRPDLPARIVHEDIWEHRPDSSYDVAVASMFFHHFTDEAIAPLIQRIGTMVRKRLLINDLERCWPNFLCAALLCLPESAGVRNDALLSVRRGFRTGELQALLRHIPAIESSVSRRPLFRIAAVIDYPDSFSAAG
jgi:hypothetical protein